ncbi:MAG: hypothetical protein R6V85_00525 [Polyangia bacterium]
MRRSALCGFVLAAALAWSGRAEAREHLELAAALAPIVLQDAGYEAFSEGDLAQPRFGADVRYEAASFARGLRLVPLIAYRVGYDQGEPFDEIDTRLFVHDFLAGLRLRGWLLPWLGLFVEARGGLLYARVHGEVEDLGGPGVRERYEDDLLTWSAGGLGGIETRISPRWLARRGVRHFGFGAEISAGYLRRGNTEVSPELKGGDDNSLPLAQTAKWGTLNLSGWSIQTAVVFSFR